jgi:hypothetical protein
VEPSRRTILESKAWVLLESPKKGPIFARTQILSYDPAEGYEWPGMPDGDHEPAGAGRATHE